jgi:hypothetical protein
MSASDYPNNLTTLAKRLRPLLYASLANISAGDKGGNVLNKIILFHASGAEAEFFPVTDAGLAAAIAAVTGADTISIPPGTFSNNYTLPANTSVLGTGSLVTKFSGQVTCGSNTYLRDVGIVRSASSGSEIVGLLSPASGESYLNTINVNITNSGAGAATGIKMQAGDLKIRGCYSRGFATGGGAGYGVIGHATARFEFDESCSFVGSTAKFSGGNLFGYGIENEIHLLDSAGELVRTYSATAAGLAAANSAATSGDVIDCPYHLTIALTSAFTQAGGVTIRNANLSFSGFSGTAITMSAYSLMERSQVVFDGTGQANATGVLINGVAASLYKVDCIVSNATGTSTAFDLKGGSDTTRAIAQLCYGQAYNSPTAYGFIQRDYSRVQESTASAFGTSANSYGFYLNASSAAAKSRTHRCNAEARHNTGASYAGYVAGYAMITHCNFEGHGDAGGANGKGLSIAGGATAELGDNDYTNLTNGGSIVYLSGDKANADHNHTGATDDGGVLTNDAHDGYSEYTEIASPSTPAANKVRLYAKDKAGVSTLYYKQDDGTEIEVGAGGASFSDGEGDPADVDYSPAQDGISTYAARRDHRHHLSVTLDSLPRTLAVVIDNTGLGSTLTNYQVRIVLTPANYDFTRAAPDGSDILITDSDRVTLIDHWVEYWIDGEKIVLWAEVPSIPASSTKTIYLYFGNSGANASNDAATMIAGADFDDGTTTGLTINTAGSGAVTVPAITSQEMLGLRVDGFTKWTNNPVLAKGAGGAWDDWGVRELCPVIDEDGKIVTESDGIWAYYWGRPDGTTGALKIGLAKSTDNGFTWSRYGSNPVISPSGAGGSWYETHIHQPAVIKLNDGTRLMMASGITAGGVYSMGVFTSTDGLSWSDGGQKLVLASFSDGAAVTAIGVPSVIKRSSGDYLCLFEGLVSGITNGWRIFGATSADFTGTWTPLNSGNPLMGQTGTTWEKVGVANPHIIEVRPGEYLMVYNGHGDAGGAYDQWQIGFASSSNLTTWTRYASNPVLSKSASGWDNLQVETCFLVKEDSSYLRLYYQGFSSVDGSHQIGLAIAHQGRLLHATSAATSDAWLVGKDLDGVSDFALEVLTGHTADANNNCAAQIGLVDSAAVPSPDTNTNWVPKMRFVVERGSPNNTGPNQFTIDYIDSGGTVHYWDGSAWQTTPTYFGGAGLYKVKIWDDGTNYKADILRFPTETTILANVASIAKSSVKTFTDGRVAVITEPLTNFYYLGMNLDNVFIRQIAATAPTVSLGWEAATGAALTVKEIDGAPSVANVTEIKVTNGKLTDNGSGSVSLDLSASGGSLAVQEIDGSPNVANVTTIKVTNGKLTDNSGGTVTLDLSGGATSIYPQRADAFLDEFVIITGCGGSLVRSHDTGADFAVYWYQTTAGNSDAIETNIYLKAGTYTLYAIGVTFTNRGKIDWSIDGSNVITGQDWYAAGGAVYNVIKSGSVTVTGSGNHLLRLTMNGKHASSSGYYFAVGRVWLVPSSFSTETA